MSGLDVLDKYGMDEEEYRRRFVDTTKIGKKVLLLCLPSHPQHDEIIEWFPII